jgi:hypothetical protein
MPGEQPSGYEASSEATAPENLIPVDQFVSQIYFEGLPLDQAARYGEESVDTLIGILRDPGRVQYHENAALTLGMIGSERGVEPLIAYIQNMLDAAAPVSEQEASSRAAYKGRVGAVIALGYIVNRTGSRTALDFLKTNASPRTLERLSMDNEPSAQEAGRQDLTKYFVLSLGISGNAEAAEHLKALAAQDIGDASPRVGVEADELIAQSLQLNDQVAREGLLKYYNRDRQMPQ